MGWHYTIDIAKCVQFNDRKIGEQNLADNLNNTDVIMLVESIKKDILATRNTILRNANQELIAMYFRIGKCISENASYGSNFI